MISVFFIDHAFTKTHGSSDIINKGKAFLQAERLPQFSVLCTETRGVVVLKNTGFVWLVPDGVGI